MVYIVSNTGYAFQFNVGHGMVYMFDTQDAVAVSDEDYAFIQSRIGPACLAEGQAPAQDTTYSASAADTTTPPAPAAQDASVGDGGNTTS